MEIISFWLLMFGFSDYWLIFVILLFKICLRCSWIYFSKQNVCLSLPATSRVGHSRFPHGESLIPLDLILHRSALFSSRQNRNLKSCLCQWPVFLLLIGLDTVTCLDAWLGISPVTQKDQFVPSWVPVRQDRVVLMNGGFGCVEHLAEENPASHSALFWNGLHTTQPRSERAPGCSVAWSKLFWNRWRCCSWVQV